MSNLFQINFLLNTFVHKPQLCDTEDQRKERVRSQILDFENFIDEYIVSIFGTKMSLNATSDLTKANLPL